MKQRVKCLHIILFLFFVIGSLSISASFNLDFPVQFLCPASNKDTSLFALMNNVQPDYYFLGAATSTAGDYTIMRVYNDTGKREALTPKKISLNGKKNRDNPLYGAAVTHFTLDGTNNPVVAIQGLNKLFLISDVRNHHLLESDELQDALGKTTSGIKALDALGTDFVVAALSPSDHSSFGNSGSGIALLRNESASKIGGRSSQKMFKQLNAQFGGYQFPCAAPLDCSHPAVAIGQTLSSMGDVVDFCVDDILFYLPMGKQQLERRLYIALQTTSADDQNSGARALVMAHYTPSGQLIIKPVVYESAFAAEHPGKIVGTRGALQSTSLHKIRILKTAFESLRYLIVLGGNGLPHETKRTVFALPLVHDLAYNKEKNIYDINFSTHGMLADVTIKKDEQAYKNPATTPEQLFSDGDRAACVGAGALPVGDIVNIYTQGTAVFATVEHADVGHVPGIFSSQALFDDNFTIIGWTEWQRVAGVQAPVHSAAISVDTNYVSYVSNTSDSSVITNTQWSNNELTTLLNDAFTQKTGGVHGLFDFSYKTPALGSMSLLIAAGFKKLLLVQTGIVDNAILKMCSTDLCLTSLLFDTSNDIGAITTVEIAGQHNSSGYLFVGGSQGLAVLVDRWGKGWNLHQQITFFDQVAHNMSLKKIGNYVNVLKIVHDDNFVYVLTDQKLDRIDLKKSDFSTGQFDVTTLAQRSSMADFQSYDCFFDLLVSEKLVLIATSAGLLRNGDGTCASKINEFNAHWAKVALRKDAGAITKLISTSVTGRAQDVSRCGGGMIYALDSNHTEQRSNCLRLIVQDTTIAQVNDQTVYSSLASKGSLGAYRKCFATDGSLFFSSSNKHIDQPAQLFESFDLGCKAVNLGIDTFSIISSIVKESSSGQWIVSGDFGARVHN